MTVLEHASGRHGAQDRNAPRSDAVDERESGQHRPSVRSRGADATNNLARDEPKGGGKIALYCVLAFAGIAAIVGVGVGGMPRYEGDEAGSWRNVFSLHVAQQRNQRTTPLKIGSVPLGIKPESVYALPTRPYFSRTNDGRTVAEFDLDSGIYTVWFGSDREDRRAQRVRFARTFAGLAAEDVLKTQVSAFGSPIQTECTRLLAHQGRRRCRYAWNRPAGTSAVMSLRSVAPSIGDPRTEMVLTVTAPPLAKNEPSAQRNDRAGQSL